MAPTIHIENLNVIVPPAEAPPVVEAPAPTPSYGSVAVDREDLATVLRDFARFFTTTDQYATSSFDADEAARRLADAIDLSSDAKGEPLPW